MSLETWRLQADLATARAEIERLTKERDEAQAEQALLLERAAGRMDAGFSYNAGNCVRGVIPDDAKAALEAYGREKVREGMQRAAEVARECWNDPPCEADAKLLSSLLSLHKLRLCRFFTHDF